MPGMTYDVEMMYDYTEPSANMLSDKDNDDICQMLELSSVDDNETLLVYKDPDEITPEKVSPRRFLSTNRAQPPTTTCPRARPVARAPVRAEPEAAVEYVNPFPEYPPAIDRKRQRQEKLVFEGNLFSLWYLSANVK